MIIESAKRFRRIAFDRLDSKTDLKYGVPKTTWKLRGRYHTIWIKL